MPRAPKATREGYEVEDEPLVIHNAAGPVTADYITKANALIEEYQLFKREMDTATKRLVQWDTKNRNKPGYDLIRMRLLMTYEGAKRMMCNRVRLLCNMNVQLPDFKDGVASLPDTMMTEGPSNIVPSGDSAAEQREARRKQQRRTIDLSDEAEDEALGVSVGADFGGKDYTTIAGYILRKDPMMNEDTIPLVRTVSGRIPNEPESAPLMRAAGLREGDLPIVAARVGAGRVSLADMDYSALERRVIGQIIDHLPENLKKAPADRPKKVLVGKGKSVPPVSPEPEVNEAPDEEDDY